MTHYIWVATVEYRGKLADNQEAEVRLSGYVEVPEEYGEKPLYQIVQNLAENEAIKIALREGWNPDAVEINECYPA